MQPICFFLTQDPIECLAKNCSWQLTAKLDVPWNFIGSQVSTAVIDEVVLRNFIREWNDNRLNRLTPVLRQQAYDRSFSYLLMKSQHFLDFGWIDIEA